MQCKHCSGKVGFGRYFPSCLSSLSLANSNRNIYDHMMKCPRCPQTITYSLQRLNVIVIPKMGQENSIFPRLKKRYIREKTPLVKRRNSKDHQELHNIVCINIHILIISPSRVPIINADNYDE